MTKSNDMKIEVWHEMLLVKPGLARIVVHSKDRNQFIIEYQERADEDLAWKIIDHFMERVND